MGTEPSGRYVVVRRRLASMYIALPSVIQRVTSAMCTQILSPSPLGKHSTLIPSSTLIVRALARRARQRTRIGGTGVSGTRRERRGDGSRFAKMGARPTPSDRVDEGLDVSGSDKPPYWSCNRAIANTVLSQINGSLGQMKVERFARTIR